MCHVLKAIGLILSRYYLGRRMYVVISEPDMIKQVLVENFVNFSNRMVCSFSSVRMNGGVVILRWKNLQVWRGGLS